MVECIGSRLAIKFLNGDFLQDWCEFGESIKVEFKNSN